MPKLKKILCLDIGSKTIGVAQSDELLILAHPVKTYFVKEKDWQDILSQLFIEIDIQNFSTIVLGYPKTLKNNVSSSTSRIDNFYSIINKKLDELNLQNEVKVILWDERLSTNTANNILKNSSINGKKKRKLVDTVAATVILDNYLQSIK